MKVIIPENVQDVHDLDPAEMGRIEGGALWVPAAILAARVGMAVWRSRFTPPVIAGGAYYGLSSRRGN